MYDSEDDRPTVTSKSPFGGQRPPEQSYNPMSVDRPTIVQRRDTGPAVVAWLYCRKGRRKGQLLQVTKARSEFGRDTESDLPIEDDYASRSHGAILLDGQEWKIFDFATPNGTFVNGSRLGAQGTPNPVVLRDNDTVVIGDSEFIFKCIEP